MLPNLLCCPGQCTQRRINRLQVLQWKSPRKIKDQLSNLSTSVDRRNVTIPFPSLWGGASLFSLHSSSCSPWLLSFSGQFHVSNYKLCCRKHGHTVFLWYGGFVSFDYSISKIARSRDRSTCSCLRTSSVFSIIAALTCIVGNGD